MRVQKCVHRKRPILRPGVQNALDLRFVCGPEEIRTPDLTRARGALYQLSYWPDRSILTARLRRSAER
jgi:hypothetical protein